MGRAPPDLSAGKAIGSALVASGTGLNGVKSALQDDGVPTPRGFRGAKGTGDGTTWSRLVLKQIILSDCYRSHSPAQLAALVDAGSLEETVARSAPDPAGVWWFARRGVEKVYDEDEGGRAQERAESDAHQSGGPAQARAGAGHVVVQRADDLHHPAHRRPLRELRATDQSIPQEPLFSSPPEDHPLGVVAGACPGRGRDVARVPLLPAGPWIRANRTFLRF